MLSTRMLLRKPQQKRETSRDAGPEFFSSFQNKEKGRNARQPQQKCETDRGAGQEVLRSSQKSVPQYIA